ncbi:MAG: TonB family protein [bacterium]
MNDRTAYIVSTILHLAVFLYLTVNLRSHYQYRPGSYISMNIAQAQSAPGRLTTPPPAPKKPEPEPESEPEPPKPQKIEKKPPKLTEDTISQLREKLSSTPTKKPTVKPTDKNTPTPRPTPRPTPPPKRTPTPRPAGEQPTPTPDLPRIPLSEIESQVPAPADNAAAPGVSGAPIGSGTGEYMTQIFGDPNAPHDFTGYAMILNKQLYRAWLQPTIRPPEYRDFITVVSFAVYQDGSISDIFLEESSGWPALDKSVLEAVQRASPLERLPMTYTASSVRVLVPFIMPKKTY